ncbi:MAG: glycosyltransferase [Bacillaceae bacterium]|nr:glycosyltransferase [Bacillaceae bacterium]
MISVIIPVYNREQFIAEAIDSVLNQTYPQVEIIVVNDGSTDETARVLNTYRDKIRYIEQENRGPSAARNTGIRAARGDFIAFLDSDDLFLPEKLAEQIRLFDQENVGLVYSWYYKLDYNKKRKRLLRPCFSEDRQIMQKQLLERTHTIRTSTVMMQKNCFHDVGLFNERYFYSQDWDMWLRTASRYDFACVKKPLAVYRRHRYNRVADKVNIFHEEIMRRARKQFGM